MLKKLIFGSLGDVFRVAALLEHDVVRIAVVIRKKFGVFFLQNLLTKLRVHISINPATKSDSTCGYTYPNHYVLAAVGYYLSNQFRLSSPSPFMPQ